MDDDATRFQAFLGQDNGKIVKELVRRLNAFFGAVKASNSELQIWTGHRYDNEPRKVLISTGSIKKSGLKIGRPTLLKSMKSGIDMTASYIRLEKRMLQTFSSKLILTCICSCRKLSEVYQSFSWNLTLSRRSGALSSNFNLWGI